MKRDLELARAILFKVEELPYLGEGAFHDAVTVPGYSEVQVAYHTMLLSKEGLIEAMDLSNSDGVDWRPVRLTPAGHEVLDSIRSDTFWEKTKSYILQQAGGLSIEALKIAVPIVLKQMLSGRP